MSSTVKYCDYYDESRNDSAFYCWNAHEWVASVYIDDRCLEIWAVGNMRINLENGNVIRYADDLRDNGILSDSDLEQISNDLWENNNWLELRDYEGEWIGDVWSGHIYHTVDEAVEAVKELLTNEEFLSEFPCKNPDYVVG